MNEEYSEYLNSEAWKKKRMQRLAIAKFRCAACTNNKAVQVHHLTYERIFDEDMADLLPLCAEHHSLAESLIAKGYLTRNGDVLFLATETVRLLAPHHTKSPQKDSRVTPKQTQQDLLRNAEFVALLRRTVNNKKEFKRQVRRMFRHVQRKARNKVLANAFILFDRSLKIQSLNCPKEYEHPHEKVHIVRNGHSSSGFRPPVRKWSQVSEEDRQRAAYERNSGIIDPF